MGKYQEYADIFMQYRYLLQEYKNLCRTIYLGSDTMLNSKLKCKLKVILAEKEMQHNEFAKLIGISPSTLSTWIAGTNYPSLKTAYGIAKVLNVSVIDIWNDESRATEDELVRMLDLDRAIDEYFKGKE